MILESYEVGPLGVNCYLAGDPKGLLMIDPGGNAQQLIGVVEQKGYTIAYVVLTHAHYDHIGGAAAVCAHFGAPLCMGREEADVYADNRSNVSDDFVRGFVPKPPDRLLDEGDVLQSGADAFRVIHTPGHTKGGICLLCGDVLFSGDTMFRGAIGRADLPTGNLGALVRSIRDKLLVLPDAVRVYPGHGPATTIGYERQHSEYYEYERFCDANE